MTKYEKIFSALSKTFDVCALNEEIDEFESALKVEGLKIVDDVGEKDNSQNDDCCAKNIQTMA